MKEPSAPTRAVTLPPLSPDEMLEVLAFLDSLDARMRALRDSSALPRAAVTRPDEFDDLVIELHSLIQAQALRAIDAGAREVVIKLPLNDELIRLARWAEPRIDLLAGLTRAGMVQADWERPLSYLLKIISETLRQLG